MKLIWSPESYRDIASLAEYISRDNPAAAYGVLRRVTDAALMLATYPQSGKIGRVAGTREFFVPGTSYILAYRLAADRLQIIRVLHTSRRWPDIL